jgi:hypothetical protein
MNNCDEELLYVTEPLLYLIIHLKTFTIYAYTRVPCRKDMSVKISGIDKALTIPLHPKISNVEITHSLSHGAEPFLRSCQLCSYSRTSQHFMESGGPLPCSQEPSTGPYPEPDQSNPYHSILSKIHFNVVILRYMYKIITLSIVL